ncbi:transposase, MuDR, MULE transposase domain protein [Tanacetum coccineum]|uniref:Transposase, MuDR, MULE transposase domain protein n=1 Tax=Tanacetum coccineum TaxID=301880 RepID=A0ABQ4Z9R0_9ASTR
MNARPVRQENTVPIIVGQHYRCSVLYSKDIANLLFFNMYGTTKFPTPMRIPTWFIILIGKDRWPGQQAVARISELGKRQQLPSKYLVTPFTGYNEEENNVTFLGSRFTGNILFYKNVDPAKHMNSWMELMIRRRPLNANWTVAYTSTISVHPENNQFIILKDPHVIGTLDGSTCPYPSWNDVDWVFLPIHVAGNHWATGVIHLANSHFYVFDSMFIEENNNVPQLSTPRAYDRCCTFKGSIQGNNSGSCGHGWKQLDCADCIWYMQRGNRHDAIALAVEKEFPLAFHDAYTREDYATNMNTLQIVQPDAHEKLCRAGPQRWSRAHCPLVRYNYMTSNSVESVNACSVIYRKEPVLKLAETYRAMVQECKQSGKKRMKSATWVVKGVNAYQYEVSDGQYIREVNLQTGICGCRKWQLSGLPCGHVIAITRFLGLTDCVHYAADWFKKLKYQGTYSESIHSLGNMQQWEFPENIQKAIPPRMDNPQPGRPKNTNRIKSQGEEPRIIRCTRCTQTGHRRDQCGQPFVVQPPVNIRTHNDQQFTQNNQPSFNNPTQQYDNTFHNINHYTSQQYGHTTYPSQPYCETPYPSQPYDQHFANTTQPYNGHHTESSQMYEQYNSQQYDAQHLDDINTNGSNSWFNSFEF